MPSVASYSLFPSSDTDELLRRQSVRLKPPKPRQSSSGTSPIDRTTSLTSRTSLQSLGGSRSDLRQSHALPSIQNIPSTHIGHAPARSAHQTRSTSTPDLKLDTRQSVTSIQSMSLKKSSESPVLPTPTSPNSISKPRYKKSPTQKLAADERVGSFHDKPRAPHRPVGHSPSKRRNPLACPPSLDTIHSPGLYTLPPPTPQSDRSDTKMQESYPSGQKDEEPPPHIPTRKRPPIVPQRSTSARSNLSLKQPKQQHLNHQYLQSNAHASSSSTSTSPAASAPISSPSSNHSKPSPATPQSTTQATFSNTSSPNSTPNSTTSSSVRYPTVPKQQSPNIPPPPASSPPRRSNTRTTNNTDWTGTTFLPGRSPSSASSASTTQQRGHRARPSGSQGGIAQNSGAMGGFVSIFPTYNPTVPLSQQEYSPRYTPRYPAGATSRSPSSYSHTQTQTPPHPEVPRKPLPISKDPPAKEANRDSERGQDRTRSGAAGDKDKDGQAPFFPGPPPPRSSSSLSQRVRHRNRLRKTPPPSVDGAKHVPRPSTASASSGADSARAPSRPGTGVGGGKDVLSTAGREGKDHKQHKDPPEGVQNGVSVALGAVAFVMGVGVEVVGSAVGGFKGGAGGSRRRGKGSELS